MSDPIKELIDSIFKQRSPLPNDRKAVCQSLALELDDIIHSRMVVGTITLEEAADLTKGLALAFDFCVKAVRAGLVASPDSHTHAEHDKEDS